MGLRVDSYGRVSLKRRVDPKTFFASGGSGKLDERTEVFLYPHEPHARQRDGMPSGVYAWSDREAFDVGSYHAYNLWRSLLATLLGTTDRAIWKNPRPGPFVEIINFADNEGFFGPVTSGKLAADFAAWRPRAEEFAAGFEGPREGRWFMETYDGFAKAFRHAAAHGEGVVQFH